MLHAWKKKAYEGRQLFDHFTKMDHHLFYQKHRTGDLMAHATNDLNAIQNVAGAGISTFADSFYLWRSNDHRHDPFLSIGRLTLIALIPLPFLAVMARC